MVYAHHGQKLLRVRDVAERLQLGQTKVFELIARGEIDSLKIDGARRFTEQAVEEFIAKREADAKASAGGEIDSLKIDGARRFTEQAVGADAKALA